MARRLLESGGDFNRALNYLPNTASDDFISLTMLVRTESWVWNDQLPPIFQTRRKARRDQKRLIREPLLA